MSTPDDYTIKDSGEREEFPTGAVRDTDEGKGRPDLLPWMTIMDLAKHYQKGCEKYGDRNWEQGIPTHKFYNSCIRHLTSFFLGVDDGEDHLIAAIWNACGLRDTLIRIEKGILPAELDTIPYLLNTNHIR